MNWRRRAPATVSAACLLSAPHFPEPSHLIPQHQAPCSIRLGKSILTLISPWIYSHCCVNFRVKPINLRKRRMSFHKYTPTSPILPRPQFTKRMLPFPPTCPGVSAPQSWRRLQKTDPPGSASGRQSSQVLASRAHTWFWRKKVVGSLTSWIFSFESLDDFQLSKSWKE